MDHRPYTVFDAIAQQGNVSMRSCRQQTAVTRTRTDFDRRIVTTTDVIVANQHIAAESCFHPPEFGGEKNGRHPAPVNPVVADFAMAGLDQNPTRAVRSKVAILDDKTMTQPQWTADGGAGRDVDLTVDGERIPHRFAFQQRRADFGIQMLPPQQVFFFLADGSGIRLQICDHGVWRTRTSVWQKRHRISGLEFRDLVQHGDAQLLAVATGDIMIPTIDVHAVVTLVARRTRDDGGSLGGIFAMKGISIE